MLIVLFVLVFTIYYIRLRLIKKNQKKLMQLVDEKTKDLNILNKELKKYKLHLENMVVERTKDLQKAKIKAEESDRLKSAFLANMSHEIRTPLNPILGLINILVEKIDENDEDYKIGEMIEYSAQSLKQLIDDIIDISKIEANQIKIFKNTFSIKNCIKNIADTYLKQDAYNKFENVEINIDIPDKDLYLYSDEGRIVQMALV